MTKEKAEGIAKQFEFDHYGFFPTDKLKFMQEVRGMCEANLCGNYNRTWTCPPALESLEEITERARTYDWGLLVQTTADMEDVFDGDTMLEASKVHRQKLLDMIAFLREEQIDFLPMSSGGCVDCDECTYPDAPCRFPEHVFPSMEAYGLMVNDVCILADTPYYYGKGTLTYTACVLFKN